MERGIEHSGVWAIALIVIVIASWLLYRYLAPKTWREWVGARINSSIYYFIICRNVWFPTYDLLTRSVFRTG